MCAQPKRIVICFLVLLVISSSAAFDLKCQEDLEKNQNDTHKVKRVEIFSGVYVKIPSSNCSGKMISFEIDTKGFQSGRSSQKKLMQRILPMFIMPFLIQSTIVPFFLSTLKFMLFKSMMVGKVALALILLNAFTNHNTFKGRHEAEMADIHYGYHGNGMEEYGAYIN